MVGEVQARWSHSVSLDLIKLNVVREILQEYQHTELKQEHERW